MGCRISKVLWFSKNNTARLSWSEKFENNSSKLIHIQITTFEYSQRVNQLGGQVVKVFGQSFDHYSSSDWSSSRKYWVRWRGSYSTMGTISSWPCWADLLPELRLQYWIGATSSASQSWKIRVSIMQLHTFDYYDAHAMNDYIWDLNNVVVPDRVRHP